MSAYHSPLTYPSSCSLLYSQKGPIKFLVQFKTCYSPLNDFRKCWVCGVWDKLRKAMLVICMCRLDMSSISLLVLLRNIILIWVIFIRYREIYELYLNVVFLKNRRRRCWRCICHRSDVCCLICSEVFRNDGRVGGWRFGSGFRLFLSSPPPPYLWKWFACGLLPPFVLAGWPMTGSLSVAQRVADHIRKIHRLFFFHRIMLGLFFQLETSSLNTSVFLVQKNITYRLI